MLTFLGGGFNPVTPLNTALHITQEKGHKYAASSNTDVKKAPGIAYDDDYGTCGCTSLQVADVTVKGLSHAMMPHLYNAFQSADHSSTASNTDSTSINVTWHVQLFVTNNYVVL